LLRDILHLFEPERRGSCLRAEGLHQFCYAYYMNKYIKYILVVVVLLISVLVVSNFAKQNDAKSAYAAAQERCSRSNPIVISVSRAFDGTPRGIEVYDGPNVPDPGEKYYCTLTEAANDGYDRQVLNQAASEDIKRLYP